LEEIEQMENKNTNKSIKCLKCFKWHEMILFFSAEELFERFKANWIENGGGTIPFYRAIYGKGWLPREGGDNELSRQGIGRRPNTQNIIQQIHVIPQRERREHFGTIGWMEGGKVIWIWRTCWRDCWVVFLSFCALQNIVLISFIIMQKLVHKNGSTTNLEWNGIIRIKCW
jgi:hypothetical protein